MDDVIDIKGKRAEKEKSKKSPDYALFQAITDAMNGSVFSVLPPFPDKFVLYEPDPGACLPLAVAADGVVTRMSKVGLARAIHRYTTRALNDRPDYGFTAAKSEAAANYWLLDTDAIPEPSMILAPSQPGYAWCRLPFVPEIGDTPTFDELFGRMTNARAVRAWIGSLLIDQSDMQQYVWLYGEGGNGKGALGRFLYRLLRPTAQAQTQTMDEKNRFLTNRLVGKRFVYFPDISDFHFPSSGLCKSITGGDPIYVEYKGLEGFSTSLKCKLLFISNEMPNLSSEAADQRRPIYARIEKIRGPMIATSAYDRLLWDEAPYFLHKCLVDYYTVAPTHNTIPVDDGAQDELKGWVATLEDHHQVLFDEHLVLDPHSSVTPASMQAFLERHITGEKPRNRRLDFTTWMSRKGVRKVGRKLPIGVRYFYTGVRFRTDLD